MESAFQLFPAPSEASECSAQELAISLVLRLSPVSPMLPVYDYFPFLLSGREVGSTESEDKPHTMQLRKWQCPALSVGVEEAEECGIQTI